MLLALPRTVLFAWLLFTFGSIAQGAEFRPLGVNVPVPQTPSHAYDLSADGRVAIGDWTPSNLGDLKSIRDNFGATGTNLVGDLDFDGEVGLSDLNYARNHGLPFDCPPTADCGLPSMPYLDDAAIGLKSMIELPYGRARGVSADGGVVVGSGAGEVGQLAYRWSATTGVTVLGDLVESNDFSIAHDVSSNGSVVVGVGNSSAGTEAFRWTEASGMIGLGDLPGGDFYSCATAVSADGKVIVGIGSSEFNALRERNNTEAFTWTSETGLVGLGYLSEQDRFSAANGISDDGKTIVGTSGYDQGSRAFRWTEAEEMVALHSASGVDQVSSAIDASADGSVIVGWMQPQDTPVAMIWDEVHGMRDLRALLIEDYSLAAELSGWELRTATAVSANGMVIVGDGRNPYGNEQGWLIRLDAGTFAPATNVPEPGTAALLTFAATAMLAGRRLSRHRDSTESRGTYSKHSHLN
jgi:probable HAF family extracellular repeat protein